MLCILQHFEGVEGYFDSFDVLGHKIRLGSVVNKNNGSYLTWYSWYSLIFHDSLNAVNSVNVFCGELHWSFPKMEWKFIAFSEFRESDKSQRTESG